MSCDIVLLFEDCQIYLTNEQFECLYKELKIWWEGDIINEKSAKTVYPVLNKEDVEKAIKNKNVFSVTYNEDKK